MTSPSFEIRPVPVAEVRPIRQAVLRPGQPPASTVYPNDDSPETWHAGAFAGIRLVGIASVYREAAPGAPDVRAYRLRGMAVLPDCQGQGCGRLLVEACVRYVAAQAAALLWCNGRVSALGFYTALGFQPVGDVFDLPFSGPHYVFIRHLP